MNGNLVTGAGERRRHRIGFVPRAAAMLAGLVGLGVAAAAGCGQDAPIGGAGGNAAAENVAEAKQGLTSAQSCLSISRLGTAGTVFDTNIVNTGLNTNYGGLTTVVAGTVGTAQRQTLIQLDLSAIPPGPKTNIIVATLNLAKSTTPPSGAETLNIHRVTSPWSESTVTWNSFAGAYDPTIWSTFTNAAPVPAANINALLTGWVQGTFANHGMLIESPVNATSFWSSEYSAAYYRPNVYVCFTVTCDPGFADCNNNGFDGCETNTTTTVANCGGCGDACNLPNATQVCANSACAVGACNLGFADCNGIAADGCETLLTTDANCGACGVACALPNAAASCATGTCTLTSCNAGHYDCDGNPANGCEATPCANGSHCASGAGCTSEVCVGGFCAAPVCNDGVQNGSETAIDCGGGACPPCATGLICGVASDCVTGVCTGGVCQAAACTDGVKNGSETAVDCGGPTCPACASGQACMLGSDCTSGVCTAGVCQAPSCNDGLKNGSETAVDCGGPACPACPPGKSCAAGSDCTTLVCAGNVCQIASCTDGVKNGNETGVDCGGGTCPLCNPTSNCATGSDCASGLCVNSVCQVPTCTPGVTNSAQFGTTTCGVGACQVTVQNCMNGNVQTCVPAAPLAADLCDGLDENCNGVVNGGCACTNGQTESCYTGAPGTLGVGLCQAGVQTCAHGQWGACVGEVTPTAETCDGLDNDCNGQVDDGLGTTTCGIGGCQVTTPNCLNGQPQTCTPRPPEPEICDGIDNDCNGLIDDGLAPVTCGVGACQRTVPSCVNGEANACVPGTPSPEVCDGIDNDCDGVVDNGNPGGNAACSTGNKGVCAAGTTACTHGAIVCNQNVQPHAEICNGLDDDCDGVIDNGNPGGNVACNTGKLGVCAAGLTVCSSGQLSCSQSVQPHAETCNGLDDDCDGVVDNGNPGGNLACSTGLLGVCAAGTTECSSGQIACAENVPPGPQQCNGLDDNCNGVVDEGCNCLNGTTQPCYSGAPATQNVGVCHGGTQTCAGGNWGACVGQVLPSAEICDGLDNDCNGVVDDGLGTISCGVGQCGRTVAACVNGQANVCVPGAPSPEICDGLDNDCDGVVDNGNPGANQACSTGKLGVCAAGKTSCQSGAITCVQQTAPSPEVCDGLDNDCNGQVDDGLGSTTCGAAGCSVTVQNCVAGVKQTCQPSQVDGQACNDGNACTQTDACHAGVCTGSNPVVCGASNQCHVTGVCNTSTGACSNPAANNGTACNDGNACTQTDTCQSGTCTGSNPVVCTASDQCHVAGVCNTSTGSCSSPAANNGTACNDGNACTQTDTCQGGTCTGGNPVVCTASDQCHVAGVCNTASGTCSNPTAANGTACNDGNACTSSDKCAGGVCGGTPYTCTATSCDTSSTCNGNGGCTVVDKASGTACPDDGNPCTSDTCDGSGNCAHPAVANGTSCGSGLVCSGTVCASDCFISGTLYASGTLNPTNACQVCTPGTSTTAWTTVAAGTSCGAGLICNGTSCLPDCDVSGTLYTSGTVNPGNACQVCTPGTSTTAWTTRAAGTSCGAGLICSGTSCVAVTPPGSGLVAYWNLDQAGPSITDLSGNGNNGTAWNVSRVAGKVGYAYQFTGTGCITVPDSTSLRISSGDAYTMMAWVDTQTGCTSDRGEFLNKENTYEMGVACSGNGFDEATWSTTSTWFWTGYGNININAWQHVAITWDGATVRAYSNGAQAGTRALNGTFDISATGVGIGCRGVPANGSAAGSSFFIGLIDEVAIYNRALSAAEISTYYSSTK